MNFADLETSQYQRAVALHVARSAGCRDALDLVQVARFVMDGRDPWAITDHMDHTEPLGTEFPWWNGAEEVTDKDEDTWVRLLNGSYQERADTAGGGSGLILTAREIENDYGPVRVVKGPKAGTHV